jgi:quercetin dioxygenase-like cupin family protein
MKMDPEEIKSNIKTNVYHITSDRKVALHKHAQHDELFYCMKGSGFGVLENSEIELTPGVVFNVSSNTLHALRTDNDLWVSSFLIPVLAEE